LLQGLLIGFGIGVLLASGAVWLLLRRHSLRVRAAERRARAAERMAEIGAMTSGLAHEIKNPLSTVGLNAQLLLEGIQELPIDDADRVPLINRISSLRRETDRLGGILQDFLQYAGQVRLDVRPTDLSETVSELADFFMPEAERHGVRLRTDTAGQTGTAAPIAKIDAKLVKQALLNLMLNATQAMTAAGMKTPDARLAKELILRTELRREADGHPAVHVHVIDTGPGIDAETVGKVFTPYFTTRAGGSGLGLPTARRLIEAHGGRIDVWSEPGKGSDFCVVLPVDGPAVSAQS
jgi:signal transduction histidine kinase